LARVRFVDNDRKATPAVVRANLLKHERKLLDGGDNDLLSFGDKLPQVSRSIRVTDRSADLSKLLDRVLYLLVEDPAVRDDDDRVKGVLAVLSKTYELVRQPGNRIRLAAASRVLNEVSPSSAMLAGIGQELPHYVQLVKAGENLCGLLLA